MIAGLVGRPGRYYIQTIWFSPWGTERTERKALGELVMSRATVSLLRLTCQTQRLCKMLWCAADSRTDLSLEGTEPFRPPQPISFH